MRPVTWSLEPARTEGTRTEAARTERADCRREKAHAIVVNKHKEDSRGRCSMQHGRCPSSLNL